MTPWQFARAKLRIGERRAESGSEGRDGDGEVREGVERDRNRDRKAQGLTHHQDGGGRRWPGLWKEV